MGYEKFDNLTAEVRDGTARHGANVGEYTVARNVNLKKG